MTSKVEISHRTIIFTVFFLIGLWFLVRIKDILLLLFIAFILMSALRPLVDKLEKWKLPRPLAILLIYALVFGVFGLSFAGIVPSLVLQSSRFFQQFPDFVARVLPYWNVDARSFTQQLAPLSENVLRLTLGIFSNFLTIVTILVVTFYLLLERKHTESYLVAIMGEEAAQRIFTIVKEVEQRLGAWLHGQLLLMTIIGVFSYIGLTLLHVDYALPLSIIAGILEAMPMIGPIISAAPAILVAFATSPFLALSVTALYFLIQQTENHLIVPLVMKRSVGISPLFTIIALMIGGRLGGGLGAILAIPAVLVTQVVLRFWFARNLR